MEQGLNDGVAVITEEDLIHSVNELSDELDTLEKTDIKKIEELQETLYENLVNHYSLADKNDSLNCSKQLYIHSFIEMKFSEMIRGFQERIQHRLSKTNSNNQYSLNND